MLKLPCQGQGVFAGLQMLFDIGGCMASGMLFRLAYPLFLFRHFAAVWHAVFNKAV